MQKDESLWRTIGARIQLPSQVGPRCVTALPISWDDTLESTGLSYDAEELRKFRDEAHRNASSRSLCSLTLGVKRNQLSSSLDRHWLLIGIKRPHHKAAIRGVYT